MLYFIAMKKYYCCDITVKLCIIWNSYGMYKTVSDKTAIIVLFD